MSALPFIAVVLLGTTFASTLPQGLYPRDEHHHKYVNQPSNDIPGPPPGYKPDEGSQKVIIIICIALGVIFDIAFIAVFVYRKVRIRMGRSGEPEGEEEYHAYSQLNTLQQELYLQAQEYLVSNPYIIGELTMSQRQIIQEKGIAAYEFQRDSMLSNNDLQIINRFELRFFKMFECSTQTNLPIPMQNEVYYFESKIYSLPYPDKTLISLGLSIKPYPCFRLPGRHPHSICYDSDGYRRYNQPFNYTNEPPPFPKLSKGDVIGVGYRTRSGTVFFTWNGKKVSESSIGGHIRNFNFANQGQIFPIIGADNSCSIHVNLGQRGFVFSEANVRYWGYAPIEGTGSAPPAYQKFNSDILLQRSQVDDDDFSEPENDFPPEFWQGHESNMSTSTTQIDHDKYNCDAYGNGNSNDVRIALNSLIPPDIPPAYDDEYDDQQPLMGTSQEDFETGANSSRDR
ncbi:Protein SSH4 [Spathaspora sp. JA1]|nr:Protein SSH4 [Spathaspora sp. JA1]